MTGVMKIYLVIAWCMLLPFVFLFDLIFGGWKDEKKEKIDTRQSKRD